MWAMIFSTAVLAMLVSGAQAQERRETAGLDLAEIVREYERAEAEARMPDSGPPVGVLVSFSVPAESLQRLAADAAAAGIPLMLRGLVGDTMEGTVEAVAGVDPGGRATWLIDPRPFREMGVTGVPLFFAAAGGEIRTVSGDVSLGYALRRLASAGGSASGELLRMADLVEVVR